ncbi:MAG: hypothetical protein ACFFD8_01885 [Candidatus Thorarchaeota archaeon]
MSKKSNFLILSVFLFIVIILSPAGMNPVETVRGAPLPNSPYFGSGSNINVYDFARNDSDLFTDGINGTSFEYLGSWFDGGYRGYRLHTMVNNLYRTEDPLPNGDFDQYDEPGNYWNLTISTGGLVKSIDNVTGGNPGYCLDTELKYGPVNNYAYAHIDNPFEYFSTITPDSLKVSFDIRFSSDISQASWLSVQVAIHYGGADVGSWSNTTDLFHPTDWESKQFDTAAINGSAILQITIKKQGGGKAPVKGHVYFDNFQYIIGTDSTPSEVGLQLNGNNVTDAIAPNNAGQIDIYADPVKKEEAAMATCWSTNQRFNFTSPLYSDISFDYQYYMYIKNQSDTLAQTEFWALVDQAPVWKISYTVPSGRPPLGHVGYCYGLYLEPGWGFINITNNLGQTISNYTYNPSSGFIKLDEDIVSEGNLFPIYASSANYIQQIYPQQSANMGGPWTNVSSSGYFVKDNYIRVMATLSPITSVGNVANISLFYPNKTLWQSDAVPVFDSGQNRVTSTVWQIPQISADAAGSNWVITVSFNNGTQSGMRQHAFSVVIETIGTKIAPASGKRVLWGDTVLVNATWENQYTGAYITDGAAQIRYIDRNLQVRYVNMTANGQGAYSLYFGTNLMSPDRAAEFYVELTRYGYLNITGTQLTYTINLVNDLSFTMIKPTQQTGPNEYTAETTSADGYTSQVKFYDLFEQAYVRNDTGVWNENVRVNFTRYHWTGTWDYYSEGSFTPNASNPIIFEKVDSQYSGTTQVKYEVTMRIVAASWDFEVQNFTIIIRIVQIATDLDAFRTLIMYPPTGDGWSQYNNNTDAYEVRLYWNEILNITVFYHYAENDTGIDGGTAKLLVNTTLYSMSDAGGGYYSYQLNTSLTGIGIRDLFVNASYTSYATQTIQIRLIVESRITQLTKNVPGSLVDLPYDDDFSVIFTFSDIVTGIATPITDATPSIVSDPAIMYTIENNYDGTYEVIFWGNVSEATYYVTVTFSRTNYTSKSQYFEIIIRPIHTSALGWAESVSVPWGTNVTITLTYNDTDHDYIAIDGATIIFVSTNGFFNSSRDVLGVDYWLQSNPDGSYTLILSTLRVATGLQPFTINVTLTKDHFDTYSVFISFQVRDNLTVLQRLTLDPGTTVPWGDYLTITLSFKNLDNSSSLILGAIIDCDWDEFYWSYSFNTTLQAYVLVIRTESRNEGSYTLTITASKAHYQTFMIIENFVLRKIQTSLDAAPDYEPDWPVGFNITIRIDYYDLDHENPIPYADVYTDWNDTYYTVIYYGNGTYDLILNTTCREIGTHSINVTLWREHFATRTVFISLTLIPIPLFVDILSSSPVTTEYNSTDLVVVTARVTDLYGRLINDSITTFHWYGGSGTMLFVGAGVYNVSFSATADTGAYVVTIQANKTNHQIGIGFIMLNILPTDTNLSPITTSIQVVVGESFEISVNFTTIYGTGIQDATVTYLWAYNRTGSLFFVGNNIYNGTLDSSGLVASQYIVYVTAGGPNVVERITTINVLLVLITTELHADPTIIEVYYGFNCTLQIFFNDTTNNLPIDGANVTYFWGTLSGSLQPNGTSGWYTISLPTTSSYVGTQLVTLSADYEGYQYALTSVNVIIRPQLTTLNLISVQSYFELQDLYTNHTGITWTIPRGEILILVFNFTDAFNNTIIGATGTYSWEFGTSILEFEDGLYIARIDLRQVNPGIYPLQIRLLLQNYEDGRSPFYELRVTRVPAEIQLVTEIVTVDTGTAWTLVVYYNDTYHNLPIIDGNLTITIPELYIENVYMIDNGNGFYTYNVPPLLFEATLHIEITASGGFQYQSDNEQIVVLVTIGQMVRNSLQWGLIAAVVGIILIITWLAYTRVLAIPWLVRKMRKMSRTIGKGKEPKLSKGDVSRIGTRRELMVQIAEPAYETIQIPALVIPTELDYEERFAEDEAIWAELKQLPRLEYDQKLELFQEMKRIPATERVWFLQDLKQQMADGTRFARKVKEEVELPPELEKELETRLKQFPQLSNAEKDRIAKQLRLVPKEEWEEIFSTLAVSGAPEVIKDEELIRPDEFPSITEEERQKLLEELKDLTDEERQKVLSTFREKQTEETAKGKVVKGKKDFVIDKSEDEE